MLRGECDCGRVAIAIPKLPPAINAYACDYCSRVGARWGYFASGSAKVEGPTVSYRRSSKTIEFHRCRECGLVIHWIDPAGGIRHMGVNMANFDQRALADVPIVVEP